MNAMGKKTKKFCPEQSQRQYPVYLYKIGTVHVLDFPARHSPLTHDTPSIQYFKHIQTTILIPFPQRHIKKAILSICLNSPGNENSNLLDRIKALNLFSYTKCSSK